MHFAFITQTKGNAQFLSRYAHEAMRWQENHPRVRDAMVQTQAPSTLIVLVEQASVYLLYILFPAHLTNITHSADSVRPRDPLERLSSTRVWLLPTIVRKSFSLYIYGTEDVRMS